MLMRAGMGGVPNPTGDPRCAGFWYSSLHPSCSGTGVDWWTNRLGLFDAANAIAYAGADSLDLQPMAKGATAPTNAQVSQDLTNIAAGQDPTTLPSALVTEQTLLNQQAIADANLPGPNTSGVPWWWWAVGGFGALSLVLLVTR